MGNAVVLRACAPPLRWGPSRGTAMIRRATGAVLLSGRGGFYLHVTVVRFLLNVQAASGPVKVALPH